jgi:hypothetical protein
MVGRDQVLKKLTACSLRHMITESLNEHVID